MQRRFTENLTTKPWFHPEHRFLLAVSGGLDSVVMAHLFAKAGFNFGLAHCNFKLRDQASDGDELFVKELAGHFSVPYYHISFNTHQKAAQNKRSIQMEARELRYDWMEAIRQQEGYNWIATAHHLNDSIETLFYNFAKGCGIHGLQGIPEQNGYIIRPLLFATKEDILSYKKTNNISFREDASNASNKYARNKIRHQLIPVLEALNPQFIRTAGQNMHRLQDAAVLMDQAIQGYKQQFVQEKNGQVLIQKKGLDKLPAINTLLYEWLKPYGFNGTQVDQLLSAVPKEQVGKFFESPSHKLLVDRTFYLVKPKDPSFNEGEHFFLEWDSSTLQVQNGRFLVEKKSEAPHPFPKDNHVAFLQLGKEAFPLVVRHWQTGDSFQPLGLQGRHQKLQDFFNNQKVTRFEKSRIWIVATSQGEICWIVGHRIDERFKLEANAQHFFRLSFLPDHN